MICAVKEFVINYFKTIKQNYQKMGCVLYENYGRIEFNLGIRQLRCVLPFIIQSQSIGSQPIVCEPMEVCEICLGCAKIRVSLFLRLLKELLAFRCYDNMKNTLSCTPKEKVDTPFLLLVQKRTFFYLKRLLFLFRRKAITLEIDKFIIRLYGVNELNCNNSESCII